ncbi:TatD family hydrolase [Metabacillus arenae]|uniref:TatD family hydrolase n=1 Tax=Metabacillus arenae TaxID=2771434 RepID=A0A926NBA0_9BACI|nr:TatD family hydrolase [Metabacillus arenae]MBD1380279.1 TatD family hydrolase [Metabacillus arenae]
MKIIDSHIHFDKYSSEERDMIINGLEKNRIAALIAVSMDLQSSQNTLILAEKHAKIIPACGFHPEQPLPDEKEINKLFDWMEWNQEKFAAIGEVGLPYYSRKKNPEQFDRGVYMKLLERFVLLAKKWDKPIILHAIYEDTLSVCDLLETYGVEKAHFHWFKGDERVIDRLQSNGYYISITPDVCYEKEIQKIGKVFPLEKIMVETDGPWPFEGEFKDQMTNPSMIHRSIETIASLKSLKKEAVYQAVFENTKKFYQLNN